jgi:hypothetical protein
VPKGEAILHVPAGATAHHVDETAEELADAHDDSLMCCGHGLS